MATILIADDYAGIREVLSDLLVARGHTVIEAVNGQQALDIMTGKENSVDLIITDYSMPKKTGLQLFTALRTLQIKTPIILWAAQDQKVLDRCRAMGFDAVIPKTSIKIDEIVELVTRLLQLPAAAF